MLEVNKIVDKYMLCGSADYQLRHPAQQNCHPEPQPRHPALVSGSRCVTACRVATIPEVAETSSA